MVTKIQLVFKHEFITYNNEYGKNFYAPTKNLTAHNMSSNSRIDKQPSSNVSITQEINTEKQLYFPLLLYH